jgi:hypothetical protein
MKNLTDVEFFLDEYDKNGTFFLQFLHSVASTTPKLQRLTLGRYLDGPSVFKDFGK